jgi:hypothetical protein
MMHVEQMELELVKKTPAHAPLRRRQRLSGTRWWFAQMRQAVANAVEWGSPNQGRPEQIDLLCLTGR